MSSFRSRIRWSSISLITLLLLIFCVALYTTLSLLLHRHIDAQLLSTVHTQADRVKEETGDLEEFLSEASRHETDDDDHHEHEEYELRETIRDSVVLNRKGIVQWKGEGVESVVAIDPFVKNQVLQGKTLYETLHPSSGSSFRRISYPIPVEGKVQYILQAQTSLELIHDTLRWLIITLGVVSIGMLGCAWAGSHWMAGKVLSPIDTLSQTATTVSAQSLDTRLLLDAPYDEFQQLSQSFNSMLERLQRVFESQRRFVGDAAHELKTPLTAMKGNVEVALQRDRSPADYQEVLTSCLGQIEHLSRLVKSLLTLTQFAGEHPPISRKPVLLKPLIEEIVSELAVLVQEKECVFNEHLQDVPLIHGDAGQLKQLLINLLDNAIRHTPRGGSVTVTLQPSGNKVCLTVEDTGSGIEPEHLPHVFDRFYRADRARDRESGGTGLGLAIAREIVLAHDGTIQVQSQVGKGSMFIVQLPTV